MLFAFRYSSCPEDAYNQRHCEFDMGRKKIVRYILVYDMLLVYIFPFYAYHKILLRKDWKDYFSPQGVIAIIKFHFSKYIPLLRSPGIPWNLEISLLALIYIRIGFYYKEKYCCT